MLWECKFKQIILFMLLISELYCYCFSCRHENILHAHSIFFDQGKLNFVMPHFHVLEELINEYRSHSKDEVTNNTHSVIII